MLTRLAELKRRLLEIADLNGANALLSWDQTTYMPSAGAGARGRQMALLSRLAHERATDPALGRLLDQLQPEMENQPYDSDEAALIRVARREFERASHIPPEFVARQNELGSATYQAWTLARPAGNFGLVRDLLDKTLDCSRELSGFFPGAAHLADPLIALSDFGVTTAEVRQLFTQLRAELVPLLRRILASQPADDYCLRQYFPEPEQLAFGLQVIREFGYDFERGRQDKTHHPYMTKFAAEDIRITTRVNEQRLDDALFSTLHECGHALYEMGIAPELAGTPLHSGASAGIHESQSRTWENLVGRSRGFWEHYYPRLQALFPAQLGSVPLDVFYRAVNKVQPSLIRTDADEVTYNLHVMLRFDLETQLLEGSLAIRDLPEAWQERYEADLGLTAPDDRDGVLQDVHWYSGQIGGLFQGYTLGNILGAQFYAAALQAHPEIPTEIARGDFRTLHGWLRHNLYRHGNKFTAAELVQRITGQPLNITPYLDYLSRKYGELYSLA